MIAACTMPLKFYAGSDNGRQMLGVRFADGMERELSGTNGTYGVGGWVHLNGLECKIAGGSSVHGHGPPLNLHLHPDIHLTTT